MPQPPELRDPRFGLLQDALQDGDPGLGRIEAAHPPPARAHREGPDPKGRIQAAVALILRASDELDVLLIRRAHMEHDPWSGHMALPGGRREEGDATLLHTAVRETSEETGIDLLDGGIRLGRLEDVRPRSSRLPLIAISTFVFGVPAGTSARVASGEVDEVAWVPLGLLQDPTAIDTLTLELSEGIREFPGFRVEHGLVWGLTYRILTRFLEICPFTVPPGG